MTATRSRREELHYKDSLRQSRGDGCPFCAITTDTERVVESGRNFFVIHNIFPYSLWDGQYVIDHLMVVPKRHINSLSALKTREKAEYVDILGQYESNGYNIYARAPQSTTKSVPHQHTHLIRLNGKRPRFVLLSHKPYIRLLSR